MDKDTFRLVFDGIEHGLKKPKFNKQTDMLAAVFMVLKLGNSFEAIAALFNIHLTTLSRWFSQVIALTAELSKGAINWWTRSQVQATMPEACR